jgi:alkylation response protein AidB-like acyl-CoA dehydrogenase
MEAITEDIKDRYALLTRQLLDANSGKTPDLKDRNSWKDAAKFGLTSLMIPKLLGGAELSISQACEAIEAIAYTSHNFGFAFALTASNFHSAIALLKQKNSYYDNILKMIANGSAVVPNAITETSSGSDIFSLAGFADFTPNSVLFGFNKTFITNALPATHFLIYLNELINNTKCLSAFIVENKSQNYFIIKEINRVGFENSSWAEVFADNISFERGNVYRVGEPGDGKRIFFQCMAYEKTAMAAFHHGIASFILNEIGRAKTSKGDKSQFINHIIADAEIQLQASKQLLNLAIIELEKGNIYSKWIAGVKYFSSKVLIQIAKISSEALSGDELTSEVAMLIHESVTSSIYAGTNQTQLNIFKPFV